MQKFEIPANLAAQIEQLNFAINTEGVTIAPKWRSIGHNGRAIEIPVYQLSVSGSGRLNGTAQSAKDAILPIINGQIAEAARQAIEAQITAEQAARQNEVSRFEAQLEEERRRAKEAADMAAIAADEQRQKILKEAAEKQAALEGQLKAIADAKASRYNKVNKYFAVGVMLLLFVISIVTAEMNRHNVVILFNKMIPTVILWFFAYVLGFIPAIFAWIKDHANVKKMARILFIDYIGTILLYIVLSDMSPLAESWKWLSDNQIFIHLGFSIGGGIFYAFQAKQAFVKLLEIISLEKYKAFFMSLFD